MRWKKNCKNGEQSSCCAGSNMLNCPGGGAGEAGHRPDDRDHGVPAHMEADHPGAQAHLVLQDDHHVLGARAAPGWRSGEFPGPRQGGGRFAWQVEHFSNLRSAADQQLGRVLGLRQEMIVVELCRLEPTRFHICGQ